MRSAWSLLGVVLAANALLTAPFAHVHRAGFEHAGSALHWHVASGFAQTQLHSGGEAEGAVPFEMAAESQPEWPGVAVIEAFVVLMPSVRAAHGLPSPEFRSHDPPSGPPSSPRAPPV